MFDQYRTRKYFIFGARPGTSRVANTHQFFLQVEFIFESTRKLLGLLELELIQTQMTQKLMLRAEVGMRVRCANKASAECIMRGRGIGQNSRKT